MGLGPAAVGTEHFSAVGQETAADQRRVTAVADETFAMPVTIVERYELRATQTCVYTTEHAASNML